MARILYQARAEPVVYSSNMAEQVTESRWHQQWTDPVGIVFGKVRATAAVVLAVASGLTAPVLTTAQFPETVTESRWHQEWSQPYLTRSNWSRITQIAASGPTWPVLDAAQEPETIRSSDWFAPLSEPVRVPQRLIAAANPFFFYQPLQVDAIESSRSPRWYQAWSEPANVKVTLRSGLSAALVSSGGVVDPYSLTQPETVTESRWHQPWSEPVRVNTNRYLQAANNPAFFVGAVNVDTIDASTQAARWFVQWADPPRARQQPLPVALHQAFALVDPLLHIQLLESAWHQPWSEPVWLNASRYLAAQAQLAFANNTAPAPPILYFPPWLDPVRFNSTRYLATYEQHFFEFEPEPVEFMAMEWFAPLSEPVRIHRGKLAHVTYEMWSTTGGEFVARGRYNRRLFARSSVGGGMRSRSV